MREKKGRKRGMIEGGRKKGGHVEGEREVKRRRVLGESGGRERTTERGTGNEKGGEEGKEGK